MRGSLQRLFTCTPPESRRSGTKAKGARFFRRETAGGRPLVETTHRLASVPCSCSLPTSSSRFPFRPSSAHPPPASLVDYRINSSKPSLPLSSPSSRTDPRPSQFAPALSLARLLHTHTHIHLHALTNTSESAPFRAFMRRAKTGPQLTRRAPCSTQRCSRPPWPSLP